MTPTPSLRYRTHTRTTLGALVLADVVRVVSASWGDVTYRQPGGTERRCTAAEWERMAPEVSAFQVRT